MSVLEAKQVTLKDGSAVTLRSPVEGDAQALIDYLDAVRRESDSIMFDPADDLPSVEAERKWIRGFRSNDGALHLLAEADGRVLALASVSQGGKTRNRHAAGVGISVRKAWHGRGLGTALMRELIAFCRGHEQIELMTLNVFHDNPAGRALYRKVGFVEDGVLPRRAKRAGRYLDVVEMSLWVGEDQGAGGRGQGSGAGGASAAGG